MFKLITLIIAIINSPNPTATMTVISCLHDKSKEAYSKLEDLEKSFADPVAFGWSVAPAVELYLKKFHTDKDFLTDWEIFREIPELKIKQNKRYLADLWIELQRWNKVRE